MRQLLIFIGWSSIIGSFVDGALGVYALWVVIDSGVIDFNLTLDKYLKNHVEFIYWVKQLALFVMPKGIALWLFSIPALIYFAVRILVSLAIGWWALNKVKSMEAQRAVA